MDRIAITIILGSLCLLSGCIEVSHKSEWSAKLNNPFEKKVPKKIDDGYPTLKAEIASIMAEKEQLQSSNNNRHIMSLITTEPKFKSFKKFKRQEK